MAYQSIKVVKGSGGFGGPLVITPTEEKHKFIYITGGGEKPEIVDKIAALTGMEAVNASRHLFQMKKLPWPSWTVEALFVVASIRKKGFRPSTS